MREANFLSPINADHSHAESNTINPAIKLNNSSGVKKTSASAAGASTKEVSMRFINKSNYPIKITIERVVLLFVRQYNQSDALVKHNTQLRLQMPVH